MVRVCEAAAALATMKPPEARGAIWSTRAGLRSQQFWRGSRSLRRPSCEWRPAEASPLAASAWRNRSTGHIAGRPSRRVQQTLMHDRALVDQALGGLLDRHRHWCVVVCGADDQVDRRQEAALIGPVVMGEVPRGASTVPTPRWLLGRNGSDFGRGDLGSVASSTMRSAA